MAVSKAQQRAVNKYVKSNYDEVKLRMPKGKKDVIQAHAAQQGESVNAYINRAIDEAMQRDNFDDRNTISKVAPLHFGNTSSLSLTQISPQRTVTAMLKHRGYRSLPPVYS